MGSEGGFMGTTDFEKLDLRALVRLAKEKKIKNAEQLKKNQIVEALKKQQGAGKSARPEIPQAKTDSKPASQPPLQEKVEESKFYVGPSNSQVFKESEWIFPQGYGQDKAVLLVRDPFWMHAYWEITSAKIGALKAQFGEQTINNSRLMLRLLDVNNTSPEKPNALQDMDISGGANN